MNTKGYNIFLNCSLPEKKKNEVGEVTNASGVLMSQNAKISELCLTYTRQSISHCQALQGA